MRLAVIVFVSASILVACSDDPGTPSAPRTEWVETVCDTAACRLASLTPVGRWPPMTHLWEHEDQLREASRWCRESESQIAD